MCDGFVIFCIGNCWFFNFFPLPPCPPSCRFRFSVRFVTIGECDYVVAARFRDFDQHSTRASKVVKDILETKDQWEHVRLIARIDSNIGCPRVAWVAPARGGTLRLSKILVWKGPRSRVCIIPL